MIMAIATIYSTLQLSRQHFARGVMTLDICVLLAEVTRLKIAGVNKAMLR